jgi:DNA-directed RNA polymerase delta subunit
VETLPDKYNDIMNLMGNRELRACFPIQELNILLEPVQKASDIEYVFDESRSKRTPLASDEDEATADDSSTSQSEVESESSLIEVDDDDEADSDDSVASVANLANI